MEKATLINCCVGGLYTLALRMVKVNLCLCFVLIVFYIVHGLYTKRHDGNIDNKYVHRHISSKCAETFNLTLAENLDVVANYSRGKADLFMWKLGANASEPKEILKFPVLVTAIDSLHYPESMGLFRSIHEKVMQNPRYKGLVKIIVYNLGMTGRQLKTMKAKCLCEIRQFPFEELPGHVRNVNTFAFKPIIVQILLMEFGHVWWLDTSVRFTTGSIDAAINFAVKNSLLFYVKRDVSKSYTVARQTDIRTFSYLNEDVCKYRNFSQTEGRFVLFHFGNITRVLVSAWAICALNEECIAPTGTNFKKTCHLEQVHDGRCHKFDQSALSILTRRLYRNTNQYPVDKNLNDIYVQKKSDIDNYFERCIPMLKCLS